jgi:hypothetical protein
MKKLVAVLLTALCGLVQAQVLTSPNLVYPSNQTGAIATTTTGGGYSGGSQAGYNASNNTIYFGYNQNTVAYTYAFSQALQNSGMTITGYNYSWDYLNQNPYNGTLSAKVNFAGTSGTSLYNRTWSLGATTDWTNVSGTETFVNDGLLASNIANFSLSFTGKDARWWAGYYGPQVRNPSLSLNYTFDACSSNPLSSPSCPGYAAAYLTQQCTANPLYNPSCPGYAVAYQTQQCNINPLYDPSCPGYAAAYLTYQCNQNPLYSTTCPGYEQAYFNQQCSTNPLYNSRCPGYAEAYFSQQCNLNGLYSTNCPNYATAYAKKMLLEQQGLATTVATAGVVAKTAEVANANTTSNSTSDGSSSVAVAVVADPIVNAAVTSTATSTSPAAAATATVSLAPAPAPAAEVKTTSTASTPPPPAPMEKPAQPSARQALAERRADSAKKDAVAKGKSLANEMGKAADMESQKQVQNVVIQAMGFTPGFDTYGKIMVPDAVGYRPFTVYNNQKNVDNRRLGMGLYGPSDRLHNDLVDSQYKE